ncbi:type III-A CRISPR-associated RAMP protein Csm4 [Megasphaera stantonii]|uniref:type III-A CRISPR-associated RAMP protein Csm4 n=1 Tax=Megasphaera stantonii TaxID=2144175 RepID=UPI003208DA38
MSYYIYQLKFDSPVHFGQAELGGNLEKIALDYPSDTLFSALCCELAQEGELNLLEQFYHKAASGNIAFSDLYPYTVDIHGECCFYVPKPILGNTERHNSGDYQYEDACRDSRKKKAMKHLKYVRASQITAYVQSLLGHHEFENNPEFVESALIEKVNCRNDEPLPYYVGQHMFYDNTGLYGIVKADEEDIEWLQNVFTLLGLSGIGGKRSSGYGKFHLYDDPFEMDEFGVYEDDKELYRRLLDDKATWQMAISMVLPARDDIAKVTQGWYALRKRSGFINEADHVVKRDSLYMVTSGSCFAGRITGEIAVSTGCGHPVYRYGKGLYLGLI